MNRFKVGAVIFSGLALVTLAFPPRTKADEWNKKTTVSFNEPVEIPGVGAQVLPLVLDRRTPRQREVLQLVAEGRTRKEIATILNISVKTVEFHKATLKRELNLRTTADFTRYAIEHGIIAAERSS
jgi:DNA-binding CsgD family transcriptional regulator